VLTPDEIDARRIFLEAMSAEGEPLNTDAPHASVNNPLWFQRIDGRLQATPDRADLHEQILEQWVSSNPHVARERSAILKAGPPGAGKSSANAQLFHGRDEDRWRDLDADVFKRYLLEAAVADGTLQQLLPEDYRAQPGQDSLFYPFELSALVHRESTDYLFNPAFEDAVERGDNLVVDGTLAWKEHADRLVAKLSNAGYTIQVVDVEATKDVAAARIVQRWRLGYLEALNKPTDPEAKLGGRWVPPTALDPLFTKFRVPDGKPLHGKSVTEVNALEVSEASTSVTQYDLYRTPAADKAAEHVERRERIDGGELTVTSTAAVSASPAAGTDASTSPSADAKATPAVGHPHSLREMLGKMNTRRAEPGAASPLPDTGRERGTGPELSG
jgi:hypothetical protein